MQCVTVTILLICFGWAHAEEPVPNRNGDTRGSVDDVVDNLYDRALQASALQHEDVNNAMLGKASKTPGQAKATSLLALPASTALRPQTNPSAALPLVGFQPKMQKGAVPGTTGPEGMAFPSLGSERGWVAPKRDMRSYGEGEYGASGTSFYTKTEKQDSYDSLEQVLAEKCKDEKLRVVINELLDAVADITEALRSALVTVEGSSNTFGDQQLSVDVIADEIMWNKAKNSKVIAYGASEEDPEVRQCNPDGEYTICWDPLDGSSIVDNNWAVGTMVGVWGSKSGTGADGLIGAKGSDQVTSLVALYGPRTTVLVALDDGVYEFSYGCTPEGCQLADGTWAPWICSRSKITISEECKIFAPANMRAAKELEGYKKLIEHYMESKYTLRYSGGLVPDVYQQFTKQQGVFSNPTSPQSPAKLRLAFEAAPFGLLVEKAGGKTSDGVSGKSVLDVTIKEVDQRTPLCIGSSKEVDRFNEMLCMVE